MERRRVYVIERVYTWMRRCGIDIPAITPNEFLYVERKFGLVNLAGLSGKIKDANAHFAK